MKRLCFLLLFGQLMFAQQYVVDTPTWLVRCDDNDDEIYAFDLTVKNSEILRASNPANYCVTYFETNADAVANTNPIINPTSYTNTSNPQTLHVRVSNTVSPSYYGITTLTIRVWYSLVINQPPNLIIYQSPFTGTAAFDIDRQRAFMDGTQSGVFAPIYAAQSDAEADVNRINLGCFVSTSNPQTLWGREYANFEGGCYSVMSFTLTVSPNPNPNPVIAFPDANFKAKLLLADTSNATAKNACNQNIKIDSNSDGEIQTDEAARIRLLNVDNAGISSLEGFANFTNTNVLFCSNNNIQNIDFDAMYNLYELYCSYNLLSLLELSQTKVHSLYCNNNSITYINLKNGIDQNVPPEFPGNYWVNNPLAFVCADSFEVSQIEFVLMLNNYPDTVISTDCTLSVNENQLVNVVKLYPNLAKDIISIKTDSLIKSIQMIDVQGRILATKLIQENETAFDVSSYSNGIYFLKITAENGIKIERFIKN
ncbi:MAG: T9SS type A sorting domain-containing protein [Flavobacterium sp.]|uniref:T9SS type A sorting domain-containing protein n=1 Tax=Flavobacterium sp. TaxID=239 RepID=UPI0032660F41